MSDDTTLTYDEELGAGYYIQVVSSFWRNPQYSTTAKAVYALLLTYAGEKSTAWPGQERLAKELDVAEKTLRAALVELRDKSLITVSRRGQGKPNTYHIHKFNVRTVKSTVQERQNLPVKSGKNSPSKAVKITEELDTVKLDTNSNIGDKRPSVSFKDRLSLIEQGRALVTSTGRKETAPGVLTELILSLYGQEVEISRVAKFVQEVGIWPLYELVTTHAGDKFNGSVLNWLWKCQETKKNKVIPGPGHASYQAQTVNTGFVRADQSHSSMPDYVQRKHRVGKYEHWTDEQMAALEASEKQVAAIS